MELPWRRNEEPILDRVIPHPEFEGVFRISYGVRPDTAEVLHTFREALDISTTEVTRRAIATMRATAEVDGFFVQSGQAAPESVDIPYADELIDMSEPLVAVDVNIAEDVRDCLEGLLRQYPAESVSTLLIRGIHRYTELYLRARAGYQIIGVDRQTRQLVPWTALDAKYDKMYDHMSRSETEE